MICMVSIEHEVNPTDHKFPINQKERKCVGYKLYNPEQIFQFILNKFFFNYTEIKRN